jgi:hypothetical protein
MNPHNNTVRWLASFPKSGNTWVRIFLANLLKPQPGRPLTLDEVSHIPYYSDTKPQIGTEQRIGKAHHPYSPNRHGTVPAVYIVRNPLDVAVSCAAYFNVPLDRMAEEVARDWPRHIASWHGHTGLILRYEGMPGNFHILNQYLKLDKTFEEVLTAISHADFSKLQQDEAKNGFTENNTHSDNPFFRNGTTGDGADNLTTTQIDEIVTNAAPWYDYLGYGEDDG